MKTGQRSLPESEVCCLNLLDIVKTIKLGLQRSLKNVDTEAKINTYNKDKINVNLIKFIT